MVDPAQTELPLRERKKLNAMRRVQASAMQLVEQHGFGEVTVEAIAEAAEVSPSSVYRYFETKEGIILWDEGLDRSFLAQFAQKAAVSNPMEAFHETLASLFLEEYDEDGSRTLRQFRLALGVPELRQAMQAYFLELQQEFVRVLARSLGRDEADLRINVIAGAMMGAFLAVAEVWIANQGEPELPVLLEQAMEVLSEPLTW